MDGVLCIIGPFSPLAHTPCRLLAAPGSNSHLPVRRWGKKHLLPQGVHQEAAVHQVRDGHAEDEGPPCFGTTLEASRQSIAESRRVWIGSPWASVQRVVRCHPADRSDQDQRISRSVAPGGGGRQPSPRPIAAGSPGSCHRGVPAGAGRLGPSTGESRRAGFLLAASVAGAWCLEIAFSRATWHVSWTRSATSPGCRSR